MKVGFIGLGNMGGAIACAVAQVSDVELLFSDHNVMKATELQRRIGGVVVSNIEIARKADVVFLGVKPYLVQKILEEYASFGTQETIWVSMAAGVSLEQLTRTHHGLRLVRIMPNTPVAIGQGMTTLVTQDESIKPMMETLLAYSGELQWISEELINAATAIAGCGPAFVYTFIEALADAGVQQGLSRTEALHLASQTVAGAGRLAAMSPLHPAQLRDAVCSPAGASIAGIVALEENGFRKATIRAVMAAHQRTTDLGK